MFSTQRTKKKKRRLELEALEVRQLLDGGGFLPTLAPLTTFASANDFDQYFLAQATAQYGSLFGTPYVPAPIVFPLSVITANGSNPPTTNSLPTPQNPSVSEGNIVQSDGAHLFVAAQNQIVIMDTPQGGGLDVASRTDVPGNIIATFLDGTHLAVISQVNSGPVYFNPIRIGTIPDAVITVLSGPLVEVRVYDVSNARAPKLNQDTVYDGTFDAASTVGDHLYVVTNDFRGNLPQPQPVSNGDGTQSYETEAAYAARVEPELQDLILPHFYVSSSSIYILTPGSLVNAPTDVFQGRFSQDDIVSSILTFDMTATNSGVTDAQTLVSGAETAAYTTGDHLYFVSAHNGTDATHPFGSIIQRFDISGDHITPGPAGAVPAFISGQFALDENNGYLRVATTIPSGDETTSSAIYVLQQNGTALNVVGALENIDPGVTYSAVRFNGNEVYLAADTELFGNPTELYVIDLTDPTNPALAGQVQSPGLESYLQVLDDGHLFALGDNDGVQLSLFDVSNPSSPAVVSQLQVPDLAGGFFPSSTVFSDPEAVTYSPGQNLLAIPIVGVSSTSGTTSYQDSLYQVDFQTGFHLVGAVSHDSPVERSLIQGDFFYTIAENSVKVQPIIQGPFVGNERMLSLGSSLEVRITDIPRLVTETPLPQINATQPFSGTLLNFTVTDPTGISVTITWGDGATSQGTITPTGNNMFSVNGQHTYAFGGPYVLTFSILRNGQDPGLGYYSELVQVGDIDSQTEYFLQRLYKELLNRPTDQLGVEYWAAELRSGISRTFVAQAIMGSPEYQIDQINYLYGTLLGRQAENGAIPSWLAYLAGHSLDDMRIAFLSSQEFFTHAGSTANFVSGLFADLLGRQASAADQMAWQTYLQLGLPPITAVTLIARSQEAAVHEVTLDFQSFLGRPAEFDGLSYFASALQAGGTSASVEAAILGSAEFLQGS
jgi:inhibitor of cysteine peptidase